MQKKVVVPVVSVVLVLLALAASSYFSPYYTIYQMKKAIDRRDAKAFSQYIDFPALRQNINEQLQAEVRRQLSTPSTRDNPLAALGAAIVSNVAKPKLDAEISPAGVMLMLRRGSLRAAAGEEPEANTPAARPESTNRPAASSTTPPDKVLAAREAHYWIRYTNASTVVASNQARHIAFTFRRVGIWSWRLVGATLPVKNLE
jgi:hypothetical protein